VTAKASIEREVKLGVWPGFTLPDLGDLGDGIVVEHAGEQELEATYYDTADLRLARWGITLRYRAGEGDASDGWTLKLPTSSTGAAGALVRDEIVVPGRPKTIPGEVLEHVAAWVRSASLGMVARMQTRRRRTVLGKTVAEVVDDEVSVLDGQHVALRFREVEVELAPDADADDGLLDDVVGRLRAAGAGPPDPTPKVVRALGPRALSPPELVEPMVGKHSSAAEVLRAGITRAVLRVLSNDAGVRLTDDAEAVHQARVGTRRLRSDLRTFAPVLVEEWVETLRSELRWYADLLGAVRDTDVLAARVSSDLGALDGTQRSSTRSSTPRSIRACCRRRERPRSTSCLDWPRHRGVRSPRR
jgi:inorganic triphosphatase YgiF